MKYLLITILLLTGMGSAYAQLLKTTSSLPVIYLKDDVSLHFVSPEKILYADISNKDLLGDLPLKNIFRIKYIPDSGNLSDNRKDAIVTITGEKFIAQYRIVYSNQPEHIIHSQVEIALEDMQPVDLDPLTLSETELRRYCFSLWSSKKVKRIKSREEFGLQSTINAIYTLDNYIFLDISLLNKTNLRYELDQLGFKIEDQKVTRASNVQSINMTPEFSLFDVHGFKQRYRNIFVFKKFSFPGSKVFTMEASEKQISGRVSRISIKYKDVLNADVITQK